VVVFEALLNLAAMFNHGNIQLPGRLDRLLRWVIVTPDMHRVAVARPRARQCSHQRGTAPHGPGARCSETSRDRSGEGRQRSRSIENYNSL